MLKRSTLIIILTDSITLPKSTFQQVEYTGIISGANDIDAAEAFIEYLLSPQINSNMPENNLMYSVLEGKSLPETNGYHYHSDIPEENSDIEILESMQKWHNGSMIGTLLQTEVRFC